MKYVFLLLLALLLFVPVYWDIQPIHFIQKWVLKFLILSNFKKINREVAKKNLLEFDDVMKMYGIQYWLSEGTALGAIRDGALIEWDDDVDTGMMESQRERFIKFARPELLRRGFHAVVVHNGGYFFGFIKDGEMIDVDIVRRGGRCVACKTKNARCITCDELIPHLQGIHSIEFLGRDFFVPGEDYLEYLYGHDWNVPKNTSLKKKVEGFI